MKKQPPHQTTQHDSTNNNEVSPMSASSDNDIASSRGASVGVQSAGGGWNLFLTGLPADTTEAQIDAAFPELNVLRVNYDRISGDCKGYAVIEYNDRASGQDAINRLHGTDFHGSRLGAHWAFAKNSR